MDEGAPERGARTVRDYRAEQPDGPNPTDAPDRA
jgi:hypothetical protein